MSLRDDILGADDLAHEDVVVREWKGRTVRVVEMDCAARLAYEDAGASSKDDGAGKAEAALLTACRMVALTAHDPETGEPAFTEADVAALAKKSPRVILRLFKIGARLSALGDKDLEAAEGKSAGGPTSSTPSA